MGKAIGTFTELNRAFFTKKLTHLGWLWYILRSISKAGCGWVLVEDAVKAGMEYGLSGNRIYALIRDGEGQFWNTYGDRLYLRGAAHLAADFGLSTLGFYVCIPDSAFDKERGGLQQFRAYLFASYFAYEKPQMLSRATIAKLFGISTSAYINYKRLAAKSLKILSTQGNIAKLEESRAIELGWDKEKHTWRECINGAWFWCRQLPNAFKSLLERDDDTSRFNNWRLGRLLSPKDRKQTRHCKMYYDSEAKAKAHHERCGEHNTYIYRGKHKRVGLWDCYPAIVQC